MFAGCVFVVLGILLIDGCDVVLLLVIAVYCCSVFPSLLLLSIVQCLWSINGSRFAFLFVVVVVFW